MSTPATLIHPLPALIAPPSAEALGWVVQDTAPSRWRYAPALAGMLVAHLAGGWALMQMDGVRAALQEVAPLMVDLLPAPAAPVPPPPPPQRVMPPPRPAPVVTAAPQPSPAPPVFEAPPPEPVPQPEVVAAEVPPPVATPPAPPAPSVEPKTVPATAVTWLQPPAPVYPLASQRRGETGRVIVRVLIDVTGTPRQVQVNVSSGYPRLDDSALTAVRATRFKPYSEQGVAHPVWVLIPIAFESEK